MESRPNTFSKHTLGLHIPGLKVIAPSNVHDASELLYASIFDPNPVIFLEHRWLHNTIGHKKKLNKPSKLGKAKTIKKEYYYNFIIVPFYRSIEAAKFLKQFNIDCEVIDLISIKPIDWKTIEKSINKTKRF